MLEISDAVSVQMLSMVVMPSIDEDISASKELLQIVQDTHAPCSLNNDKVGLYLPPQPVSAVPEDRHAEAALAVDEADDPLLDS